jgi:hypothetical protein
MHRKKKLQTVFTDDDFQPQRQEETSGPFGSWEAK